MINEKEFLNFLDSDLNNSYTFVDTEKKYRNEKSYAKVKINEDYSIVLDFGKKNFESLENFGYGLRDFEVEALYFPKIKSLIIEQTYDMIHTTGEYGLKIYNKEDLFDLIYKEIITELKNHETYLLHHFQNERELIDDNKSRNKDYVMEIIVGRKQHKTSYLYFEAFKKIQNRQTLYDYLLNPTLFIKNFVDSYLKNEAYKENIRNMVAYEISITELLSELKDDKFILKCKTLYELLNNDLENAKKLWVITKDGKEKQVENFIYPFRYNEFGIGRYSENVELENIKAIKYGRKIFQIN